MMILQSTYRTRPVRCLEIWEANGWRIKVYGIAYNRPLPRAELIIAAKRAAASVLPQPAVGAGRYGVGFLGIHDARGGCYVFADWWADENELHHYVFTAPEDRPEALVPLSPTGPAACVYDLAVIGFEREAWLDAVLNNPAGSDLERYLQMQLNGEV